MIKTSYFDAIDSEEKAYWLGFICADGHIFKSLKQISILLSSRDTDHLLKLAQIFNRPLEVTEYFDKRTEKTYKRVRLMLNSKAMCSTLICKGIPQQKTYSLDGTVFEHISGKLISHFTRGYFDGDGCISKINIAEYRVAICGTKAFLEALQYALPVVSTIHSKPGVHLLQFAGLERVNRFKEWLYKDAVILMERKKHIFDQVPQQRGSSKYKGVYYIQSRNRWAAGVYENCKSRIIGQYKTEEEAYACRNQYMTSKLPHDTSLIE